MRELLSAAHSPLPPPPHQLSRSRHASEVDNLETELPSPFSCGGASARCQMAAYCENRGARELLTGFVVVCPVVAAVSKPRLRGQHLSLARCLPQHTWTPPLSPTGFTIQLVTSRHQHRAGTFINCDANWRKHTLLW